VALSLDRDDIKQSAGRGGDAPDDALPQFVASGGVLVDEERMEEGFAGQLEGVSMLAALMRALFESQRKSWPSRREVTSTTSLYTRTLLYTRNVYTSRELVLWPERCVKNALSKFAKSE